MTKDEIIEQLNNQESCITSDMIKRDSYTKQDMTDYGYLKHLKVGDLVCYVDEYAAALNTVRISIIESKIENYDSGGGCLLTAYFLKNDDINYLTRQDLVKLTKSEYMLLKLEN
jgi:hypothetical protein